MQIVTLSEAISNIKSEDIVGISGFLGVGEPFELIEELVRQNQQNLTIVSVVTSQPGKEIGVGRLCENHQVKKYIAAHVELPLPYNMNILVAIWKLNSHQWEPWLNDFMLRVLVWELF